jgi:diaminopimelate decarboxylase
MPKTNPQVVYLPAADIRRAAKRFRTPFFIYEEKRLRENCRRFRESFRRYFPTFSPLFAVKANTNPEVLKVVFSEGFGADASSEAEAWITRELGATGMYTGNYTTDDEFRFVSRTGMLLNLDDISMLPTIKRIGVPEFLSFRVNPGISKGSMASLLLAGPDAKFGVPPSAVVKAYRGAKAMGVKRFGIHMMTGSNVPDERYFVEVTAKLLEIAGEVHRKVGIEFECMNIGGGFGVPYRPAERSLNLEAVARGIRRVVDEQCARHGLREPVLMAEPGRFIGADAGWLVARVNVIKDSFKKFVGVDAGMNDLPRPAFYGAYHHITVLGKSPGGRKQKVSVVGRLCENNDQFGKDRLLPVVRVGDIVVIHNAGAHSYAMGNNYNNRLRSAEYMITLKGAIRKIRRAETIEDLFRTTDI